MALVRARLVKMYLLRSGLTHDRRALVALAPFPNASQVPTTISLTKSWTLATGMAEGASPPRTVSPSARGTVAPSEARAALSRTPGTVVPSADNAAFAGVPAPAVVAAPFGLIAA